MIKSQVSPWGLTFFNPTEKEPEEKLKGKTKWKDYYSHLNQ